MTTRKYELTTEKTKHEGRTLYRIRALRDFEDVKMGDLGGFVECEINLSHSGDCWIYDDSKVIGRSKIVGCSKVKGKSIVENSTVYNSTVEESVVMDYSIVENSIVKNYSIVESSNVTDSSIVMNKSKVTGGSMVMNKSTVMDYSAVKSSIVDNSTVKNYSIVENSIVDNSTVDGRNIRAKKTRINNAKIDSNSKYITVARIGSRNDTLTAYRCANGEIGVATGCFTGNIDEFVEAVKDKHKDNKYAKQYLAAINLIKLALNPGIKQ
ncbi:hypothetical protein [uncultured Gilliamella sp.]|uniref:hypothetical protein n=1 Tax=uncultured Gilliamella sp. TaxID=1193505 RepID=UPI0025EFA1A1|nr:hypothetical protein [uncultured Gilliamella sp.]